MQNEESVKATEETVEENPEETIADNELPNVPEEAHAEEEKPSLEEETSDSGISEVEIGNTSPRKAPSKKLIATIARGIAAVIVVIAVLSMSALSPQAKADELYGQEKYAEALKAYKEIGDEDKNGTKMSDCRYWLLVDYLLDNGPYTTTASDSDVSWTVEGYSNGDITCTSSGGVSGSRTGANIQFAITIHHGETIADFTASSEFKFYGLNTVETGSGKIDLPSYSYGKKITFEQYEHTGTTSNYSFIKGNSGAVKKMIQEGLLGALGASGTDTGLSDLGFTNLG